MRWWLPVVAATWVLGPAGAVRADDPPPRRPAAVTVGASTLALTLPAWPGLLDREESDDELRGLWTVQVAGSSVIVELRVFAHERQGLREPDAVVAYARTYLSRKDYGGDPGFAFAGTETLLGPTYGWVPAAALAWGAIPNAAKPEGEVLLLGGVLETHAYKLVVECRPALPAAERTKALAFLREGVRVTGPVRDPRWTDAEAAARWKQDVPTDRVPAAPKEILRTKHYIVLAESGGGAAFGKRMEECYEQVQKVFPFPEVAWRRLLPVFLFKHSGGYIEFAQKNGMGDVKFNKGRAWRDAYVTFAGSTNDPTHLREATLQILENRLHLVGGGSWFHEGLAEYMASTPSQRRSAGRQAAKSERFCPLRTFVAVPDLANGAPPLTGIEAYAQAASIVEYLREGFKDPALFQRFVHEVGSLPEGDVAAHDTKLKEIYGLDLDGLQAGWLKYWASK